MSILNKIGLKPHAIVVEDLSKVISQRLLRKIEQSEYEEAEQILSNASDENREILIYGFASSSESVQLAITWTKRCPSSSLAHTVLGASLIISGWKIRGGSYADDVNPAAWEPFLNSLECAKKPLKIAANLNTSTADPYSWLIHAEFGGDGSREILRELFREAISRVPFHWPAHYKYFSAITQKWGGDHREMFQFAQDASQRAPRGSIIHSLVATSFNEYILAEGTNEIKRIRSKRNAEKLRMALHSWLDSNASTLSQKLEEPKGGFYSYGLNQFAFACYACGAFSEAREVVNALNGEIEVVPWAWMASGFRERIHPGFVYDRVVKDLGKFQ